MQALAVVGLGAYNGGLSGTTVMDCGCLVCLGAGLLLLAAAFWCLCQAPQSTDSAFPPAPTARR